MFMTQGKYPPTIDEMRRVARYLMYEMNLHSAAGKLLAKADKLERVVDELMKVKRDD
jgi:hypothetical protein